MGKRDRSNAEDKGETSKRSKSRTEDQEEEEQANESSEMIGAYIEHKKVRSMTSEEVQRLREEMSELIHII